MNVLNATGLAYLQVVKKVNFVRHLIPPFLNKQKNEQTSKFLKGCNQRPQVRLGRESRKVYMTFQLICGNQKDPLGNE